MNRSYDELGNGLNSRNIDFELFQTREDLIQRLLKLTEPFETIGIGNSQTLKAMDVSKSLSKQGKVVYDKTYASDKNEVRRLKKQALTADCYITSTNALSMNGELVNVDHSGNRVAAMTYGPDKVIVIATTNKLVENEGAAIKRALQTATPKNARRAGIESPCSIGEPCAKCDQSVRVCNYLSIIRGQHEKGRMVVLLLEEELGF